MKRRFHTYIISIYCIEYKCVYGDQNIAVQFKIPKGVMGDNTSRQSDGCQSDCESQMLVKHGIYTIKMCKKNNNRDINGQGTV